MLGQLASWPGLSYAIGTQGWVCGTAGGKEVMSWTVPWLEFDTSTLQVLLCACGEGGCGIAGRATCLSLILLAILKLQFISFPAMNEMQILFGIARTFVCMSLSAFTCLIMMGSLSIPNLCL